eukprot:scaffold483346_cov31-Prasinocladus_malaysianus.AAC.1
MVWQLQTILLLCWCWRDLLVFRLIKQRRTLLSHSGTRKTLHVGDLQETLDTPVGEYWILGSKDIDIPAGRRQPRLRNILHGVNGEAAAGGPKNEQPSQQKHQREWDHKQEDEDEDVQHNAQH